MPNISPVTFPIVGDATKINIVILNFPTNAKTCTLYFELLTDSNVKCVEGNYQLTETEFANWGFDNKYIEDIISTRLGITILEEVVIEETNPADEPPINL